MIAINFEKKIIDKIVLFHFQFEGVLLINCIIIKNNVVFDIFDVFVALDIDEKTQNLLLQNKNIEKYKYLNVKDFLNVISWISPDKYCLYSKYAFYVELFLSLEKLKNLNSSLNEKLKNLNSSSYKVNVHEK